VVQLPKHTHIEICKQNSESKTCGKVKSVFVKHHKTYDEIQRHWKDTEANNESQCLPKKSRKIWGYHIMECCNL